MTRPAPLLLMFFFVVILYMKTSAMVMWIFSGVMFLGLVILIFAMYQRDMFSGPGTLVDDARRLSNSFLRDEGGDADTSQENARAADEVELEEKQLDSEISSRAAGAVETQRN